MADSTDPDVLPVEGDEGDPEELEPLRPLRLYDVRCRVELFSRHQSRTRRGTRHCGSEGRREAAGSSRA